MSSLLSWGTKSFSLVKETPENSDSLADSMWGKEKPEDVLSRLSGAAAKNESLCLAFSP